MKKVLLAVSAILAVIPAVHAADQGVFVSLSGGQTRLRADADDIHDRAIEFLAGYKWAVTRTLSLGVEAGYGDLGKIGDDSYSEDVLTDIDGVDHLSTWREKRSYKTKAYLVGVNGQWDMTDRWNVSLRYGLARLRTNFVIDSTGTYDDLSDHYRTDIKDRHDSPYYGAGVGYKLTDHLNLSAVVDHYHPSFRDVPGDTASHSLNVVGVRADYVF